MKDAFKGIIIEESLENKDVLGKVRIINTEIEKVTPEHKTPWIVRWTLHTVEIPEKRAEMIANELSNSLDSKHKWYADFKNKRTHYIVFYKKIFCVTINGEKQYEEAKRYGASIGIPIYQLDFDK